MVSDTEYDSFTGLLNGSQVNTLSSSILIEEVQLKTREELKDSTDIYILHDPCDIRKPSAPKLEGIGKVLSLNKQVVHGYKTFNSVAIDIAKQGVNLLCHEVYSTTEENYVSQEEVLNIANCDARIQGLVANNSYMNGHVLYKKYVKESSDILKKDRPEVRICHVSDREFDNEVFFETIDKQGDNFITRLKLSRLSNETKTVLTPKGKISKKIAHKKLVDKSFKHEATYKIDCLSIKGKVYKNVDCRLEWESLVLNQKTYHVVRITLLREGKSIFEHPMLLLTNKKICNGEDAKAIYKGYILRFKIEVVFRFLKQNLGWETFQVRTFQTIKNLLAIAFFLVAYFKELEQELKNHPLALFLCQLAKSKGKVTLFFLLEGLTKLVHFQEVQIWKTENNISDEDIKQFMAQFKTQT